MAGDEFFGGHGKPSGSTGVWCDNAPLFGPYCVTPKRPRLAGPSSVR
jgi:hypothetical protein